MKEKIHTHKAPEAIGPYSQAIKTDTMLFLSGQIAIDPSTGEIVSGGVEQQTMKVMENLKAVLESAGLNMSNVVKTTIFLKDLDNFSVVNKVYSQYFDDTPPARATVEVAQLPKDAEVEIDAIAIL